jgi:DNA-binding IclR family transcriptional regulator
MPRAPLKARLGAGRRSVPAQGGEIPATALKGVRRAIEVLEHLAITPGRPTDIAEALQVSWATLHRTLTQLEQGGFVARDRDSGRFAIGPRLWFIGTTYVANHRVLEAARTYVDEAAEAGEYTAQLVERSGRLAVTLYAHHVAGEVITKTDYGYHFPLHCGSKGQVLLAFAEPAFIARYLASPLESLTSETITEPNLLRQRLEEIRAQGYARTEGDVQRFTGSVSAPVFDRERRVIAAVCLIGKRSTVRGVKSSEAMIETVLKAAQSSSIALGWKP